MTKSMTTRFGVSLLCGLLLCAATSQAFADANTAMSQVSTTRLKAKGNNEASPQNAPVNTSRSNKKHGAPVNTSRSNKKYGN